MELRRRKAALAHREHLLAGSRGEGHAGNIYPPRAGFLDEPDTAGLVLRHLDVMRHVSARADLAMLLAAAIHDEAIHGLVANCMAGWRRSRRRRQARRAAERSLGLCLSVRARPIPKFPVEGLAVFNTAAQELWPVGHGKVPRDWLWQQTPKLRMMPAQIVTTAVTVSANARAQPHHLSNYLVSCQVPEIVIHCGHRCLPTCPTTLLPCPKEGLARQESGATLMRRSDGYNEKCCAAEAGGRNEPCKTCVLNIELRASASRGTAVVGQDASGTTESWPSDRVSSLAKRPCIF
jgi:hypothetical protein